MSEPIPKGWGRWHVGDLIEHHFSGPSPTCEERNIQSADEWGVLKTTAVVWGGWNEEAHKVLPRSYWGQSGLEVRAGDVLVTKAGPRHRVGVVVHVPSTRRRLIVSGKLIGLRVRHGICYPDVLAGVLALSEPQKYLDDRTTGMAESQVNFANKALLQTPVTLPPPREQQVISKIKGALDNQIRQTEVLIVKLERIKQGLITDLLTRGIGRNGQLRPTTDQAPNLYKDSPLGLIPREWEHDQLSGIVEPGSPITYGVVQPGPAVEGGVPFIRGGDIHDGKIGVSALRTISERISEGYRRTILQGGEIVMSLVGYPGEVAVVPPLLKGANLARQVALIRIRTSLNADFVACYLSSQAGKRQVLSSSLGSAQQVVNLKDLRTAVIPIPTAKEQETIIACIRRLSSRIEAENSMLQKLEFQKVGLMDDLLTGHVRVPALTENAVAADG